MERKYFLISFFLSLLFLSIPVSAQISSGTLDTVSSILLQFSGVIFIVIFVVILLIIGGVIKTSSVGGVFSLPIVLFIILIVILFFFPQLIPFPDYSTIPASFKYWEFPEGAKNGLQLIGLPRDWGYIPAIIYLLILPFAALYTIVWAFLSMLAIFPDKRVNRLLAFVITLITLPVGWFVKMVWAIFGFMGFWSIIIFAATFILGIFFRGAGVTVKEYGDLKKHLNTVKKESVTLAKDLEEIKAATAKAMDDTITSRAIPAARALNLSRVERILTAALFESDINRKRQIIDEAIDELRRTI